MNAITQSLIGRLIIRGITLSKNKRIIFNIVFVALFAALCYVSVFINIPIPSIVGRPMIHLGNFVLVIASLFLGSVFGGTAGAIGMGLYDLMNGYGIWMLKTVTLKFIYGFSTGFVFKKCLEKLPNVKKMLLISSCLFFVLGIVFVVLRFSFHGEINLSSDSKVIIYDCLYIFSFVVGIFLFVVRLLKIESITKYAVISSTIGVFVNIIGEFIAKVIKMLIVKTSFEVSILSAVASLPATFLNGLVVILLVCLFFLPLYHLFYPKLHQVQLSKGDLLK